MLEMTMLLECKIGFVYHKGQETIPTSQSTLEITSITPPPESEVEEYLWEEEEKWKED